MFKKFALFGFAVLFYYAPLVHAAPADASIVMEQEIIEVKTPVEIIFEEPEGSAIEVKRPAGTRPVPTTRVAPDGEILLAALIAALEAAVPALPPTPPPAMAGDVAVVQTTTHECRTEVWHCDDRGACWCYASPLED